MRSNNTYFNLLASFAYLGRNKDVTQRFFDLHRRGVANVMVDSGAFTKHNAREVRDWLTLDSYCDFISHYEDTCEKYVMLDVIGKEKESKENYEKMVQRGLHPMFVLTMFDNDWNYLRSTMDVNENCCVAGGTRTKGDWLRKRFQDTMAHTDGRAKIHALGYVTHPDLYRAPIVSGDSTSWRTQPQKFGWINVFTEKRFIRQWKEAILKGEKIMPEVRRVLNELEITPTEFAKRSNHIGGASIGVLMSQIAYIKWQKYAYKYGKRLFLALSSEDSINQLVWVKENLGSITYEKFCKEFKKSSQ